LHGQEGFPPKAIIRRREKVVGDERASGTRRAKEEVAAARRELEAERARHAATAKAAEETAKAKEAAKAENKRLRAVAENARLQAEKATVELERLKTLHSEPLLDEDGREVGRVPARVDPGPNGRKRRRALNANALRQLHQAGNTLKKVKVEKAATAQKLEAAEDDLEEAQETLGYVVQSENNKMTEIDTLKAKVAELERALENARR
jgi:hypothetical protein